MCQELKLVKKEMEINVFLRKIRENNELWNGITKKKFDIYKQVKELKYRIVEKKLEN